MIAKRGLVKSLVPSTYSLLSRDTVANGLAPWRATTLAVPDRKESTC